MKKAKIMLMAIAVLGVVGGALAFKAKAFIPNPLTLYSYTTVGTQHGCLGTFKTTMYTTTADPLAIKPYSTTFNTTATTTAQCTAFLTIAVSE